jgi:hypothetical protein
VTQPDFRALCAKTVEHWESGASQKEMHFFVEHLKAALAQPAPEPVAHLFHATTAHPCPISYPIARTSAESSGDNPWWEKGEPLYVVPPAQPAPEPPTDEELDAIWWKQIEAPDVIFGLGRVGFRNAARAVWALAVGQDNG